MSKTAFLGLLSLALFSISPFLHSKSSFPARGFAKILTKEEALHRLERYRNFLTRDLSQEPHHQAYALRFRFRHMPRRGEEVIRGGTLSGLALGHGTTRIDLDPTEGQKESLSILMQNSAQPKAWRHVGDGEKALELDSVELLQPLIPGMNQSPFDLLMPFVFWEGTYEKSGRVAGRPAHVYGFSFPDWVVENRPTWKRITLAIDDQYEAPLKIEIFSSRSVPHKTFLLNSLKKINSTWIVKTLDCKDRTERSNTRFEVLSAALQLDLDPIIFTPAGLERKLVVPEEAFISAQ